jgi:hypothetical protein
MNIEKLIKDPNKIEEMFADAMSTKNKELIEALLLCIKKPYLIYTYAKSIVKRKINDELENVLATDIKYSFFMQVKF